MHDIHMQGPPTALAPKLGLEALVEVVLLMAGGNTLSQTYWFYDTLYFFVDMCMETNL